MKTFSLLDMVQFIAKELFDSIELLKLDVESLKLRPITFRLPPETIKLQINRRIQLLKKIESAATILEMVETKGRCEHFLVDLEMTLASPTLDVFPLEDLPVPKVESEINGIRDAISKELGNIKFAFIQSDNQKYFEQNDLFGRLVSENFHLAIPEIKAAGNCLAADLHTAAVFHLMRVVNIGLRELARSFKIKKIGEKKLEYCLEGSIIKAIEDAVDKKLESVDALKRDAKWEKQKEIYQGLLVDIRFFKDVVRDPVAHARKSYTRNGALDVFIHVRDFMGRLAIVFSVKIKRKDKGLVSTESVMRILNTWLKTKDEWEKEQHGI